MQLVDKVLQIAEGKRTPGARTPVVQDRKGHVPQGRSSPSSPTRGTCWVRRRRIELIEIRGLDEEIELARYETHDIRVVVDRLVRREGIERRLTDSMETALRLAEGVAEIEIVPPEGLRQRADDARVQASTSPVPATGRASKNSPPALLVQLAVWRV